MKRVFRREEYGILNVEIGSIKSYTVTEIRNGLVIEVYVSYHHTQYWYLPLSLCSDVSLRGPLRRILI